MATKLRRLVQRMTAPLRRSFYLRGRFARAARVLPARVRRELGLDHPEWIGTRRIEVGGGPRPQPGYLHVDVDTRASHVEAFANAWKLPFPDAFADELVAIHSLEHIPPWQLMPTLHEWRRVLAPGGRLQVHVPNAPELMQAFMAAEPGSKWRLGGALLGQYCGPAARSPADMGTPSDHQALFDLELLTATLSDAGFVEVRDLTETTVDFHTDAWSEVVRRFSLVVEAAKPGSPA